MQWCSYDDSERHWLQVESCGRFEELRVIACVSLLRSLGIGLLTAMDTLTSQAYGAKNFRRVGIVFQRAMFILAVLAIPVSPLSFRSHPFSHHSERFLLMDG